MRVRMLDGAFKGEVKNLRPDVALEWLRRGGAERVNADEPTFERTPRSAAARASSETPAVAPRVEVPPAPAQPPAKTGTGRKGKR